MIVITLSSHSIVYHQQISINAGSFCSVILSFDFVRIPELRSSSAFQIVMPLMNRALGSLLYRLIILSVIGVAMISIEVLFNKDETLRTNEKMR